MDSLQNLHEYFNHRQCELHCEIAQWNEGEGLVWLSGETLPKVLEDLWVDPKTRPVLLTHLANDERKLGQGFVIYLVLHFPWDFTLTLGARGIGDHFPTLSVICPALNWAEREVQDLFGLVADGHPDPRSLVLHPGWPEGFHPLRKSGVSAEQTEHSKHLIHPKHSKYLKHEEHHEHHEDYEHVKFRPEPLVFTPALGEGTFEVPVGPIHAGIIEPGHFRFQTIGETVLHLDAQLFYTHKGIEKLMEGKSLEEGLKLVERVCGVCTVSHSLAYCEAVEKLAQLEVSRETLCWRTVLAELERLYNHVGDIGNMCAGVGFALGNFNGLQNKEQLQRLNKEIFGHRFLRGAVTLGGVRIRPDKEQIKHLRERLAELQEDFERWLPLILEHDGFRQRAVSTGVLKEVNALDLGTTGPAARAAGVAVDWRERHAHLLYPELQVKAQVETSGDVWARLMVRVNEVRQSYELLDRLLNRAEKENREQGWQLSQGAASAGNLKETTAPYSFAWGCVESPRGTDVVWLMTDEEGKIYRCRIRSASYANWPSVALTVPGNIVPDFPLINKSFELCYSCCDR
jgi:Ni,Fe-hydrogenase III large subunit/Ni,Fe-hydrogenase III component G